MILRKAVLLFVGSVFAIFILFGMKKKVLSQDAEYQSKIVLSQDVEHQSRKLIAISDEVSCFDEKSNSESLREFEYKLKDENNIFFHETSCFGNDDAILKPRQACAVESAGKMNPNMTVYLLYLSPSKLSEDSEKLHEQLNNYPNIKVRRITISEYVKNTPSENWFHKLDLKKTMWPNIQMADILRYITLWKYGGMYFDLDVVILKNLNNLKNFVGAQDSTDVAAGAMGFSKSDKLGRKVATDCLNELMTNFRGDIWGHNAPGVITRVLKKMCTVSTVNYMTNDTCQGFDVFLPYAFYPIHYSYWKNYFHSENLESNMKSIKKAYAIHVWNKLSKNEPVQTSSKVPYSLVAEEFCPKVYSRFGTVF